MPLFFPNGVRAGEVIDPEKLASEFIAGAAVADQTDQWNWVRDALPLLSLLNGTDAFSYVSSLGNTGCNLKSAQGKEPTLPDDVGADANIWKIPFKRGLLPIGEGTLAGELQCSWTTEYPELVMIVLACQYVRRLMGADYSMNATLPVVRAQVRIQLDGQVLPGSGPFGTQVYDIRGTGYGANAGALTNVWVGVVPAGAHVVQGVAGQSDTTPIFGITEYQAVAPVDGVCIGSRSLFVLRFGRGDILPG